MADIFLFFPYFPTNGQTKQSLQCFVTGQQITGGGEGLPLPEVLQSGWLSVKDDSFLLGGETKGLIPPTQFPLF